MQAVLNTEQPSSLAAIRGEVGDFCIGPTLRKIFDAQDLKPVLPENPQAGNDKEDGSGD